MEWWNGFFWGGAAVSAWMIMAFGCLLWMEAATRKSRDRSDSEDSQY